MHNKVYFGFRLG